MKILILGSGVLGVTAAYVLAARGHSVEVIDRQSGSGGETSFANGGQLSYSHAEPWANPHVLKKLPGWLIRSDSPLIFRPRADLDMIRWGLRFLTNCTHAAAYKNAETILRLGLYSRLKMAEIMKETNIAFDYSEKGILHVFSSQGAWEDAKRQADFQAKLGCEQRVLTTAEVMALEPALQHTNRTIAGGLHSILDSQGDAYMYCVALAEYCTQKFGVKFHYGTTVTSLETDGKRIVKANTDKGEFRADSYMLSLGSYSPLIARKLGIRLPIYPMKGYSITLPFNNYSPNVSVTDGSHKIVLSRLGDRLRIAGTAEFSGYNHDVVESRIRPIVAAAKTLFPKADWDSQVTNWACLRPSTPEGPPILGSTDIPNFYLNTGHGTLGWTQAAASAYIVADIIEKRAPEISLTGLTL